MPSRVELVWGIVFVVLLSASIPWFLWGDATTAAGLPLWLWWHVAWMGVTAAAFAVFARRDWGAFVEVRR